MTLGGGWRVLLAFALLLAFLLAASLLFGLTDRALDLWERLEDAPPVFRYGALAAFASLGAVFTWLAWRIRPRRRAKPAPPQAIADPSALAERAASLDEQGVDTDDARSTLAMLAGSASAPDSLDIVLFGAVSTGKSSLARALLPDAEVAVGPLAGTTQTIQRFEWQAPTGARIRIADLPGLEAVGTELDEAMLVEARRAHVVVFVTDGDLTRQQVESLVQLRHAGKPLVLTLNKADRMDSASLAAVRTNLGERLAAADDPVTPALVVTIAGGERTVTVQDADGAERRETRPRDPDITELVLALEELLGGDLAPIHALRQRALLTLADEQLAAAERQYRQARARQIVTDTTRKAVIGALAAVTPGTDVVIQGYLGTDLTRRLCRLYGQEPRDIEISRFLDLSQSRVGRVVPVALAIAGNACKAFPGVGTIAGGLVHAVAYGLIFDAVGRGLASSLEQRGRLQQEAAAEAVNAALSEDLTADVRRIATLALDHWQHRGRRDG